jgi:hypothetical protein
MTEQDLSSENKPERDEKGRLLPGNTANPNGRPPGSLSITSEIKKKLQEIPEGKEKTYLAYLIDQILKKAVIEGDQQTIKQIWNYIDGMPQQKTDITTEGVVKIITTNESLENATDTSPSDNSQG